MIPKTKLSTNELFVLLALNTKDRHGLDILFFLETQDFDISVGIIYRVLARLNRQNLVCPSCQKTANRKSYKITETGKIVLGNQVRKISALTGII